MCEKLPRVKAIWLPAIVSPEAITRSVHCEVIPAPVPWLLTVQATSRRPGSPMTSDGAVTLLVARSANGDRVTLVLVAPWLLVGDRSLMVFVALVTTSSRYAPDAPIGSCTSAAAS